MMQTSAYLDAYPALRPLLPGQHLPWLQQARAAAFARFAAAGFPSPRDEDWRYTNLSALAKRPFLPLPHGGQVAVDRQWLASHQLADAWTLVLVDGHFRADLSRLDGLPAGVTVLAMAEALALCPDAVAARWADAAIGAGHGLTALADAWFSDGLYLHVPAGTVVAAPIQCLHVATHAGGLAATRSLVALDAGAGAELVQTFIGADADHLTAAVAAVALAQDANLTLHTLQAEGATAHHYASVHAKLADGARLTRHQFALGGGLARSEVFCGLARAAQCELNGLYLASQRQHLDNCTRIVHAEPYGTSRQTYQGVVDGRARGVFQGRVVVAEQAQKTDSTMSNRNLLLSADAEADTKPQLEIYADDVKCSHGVTVGQLDEQAVFYLTARGLDGQTARNMLTFAFANQMVGKVRLKSLHDLLLARVLARFPQAGAGRAGIETAWL